MTDLEIPDEAVAAADMWSGQIPSRDLLSALESAVPLIVAIELERLADNARGNARLFTDTPTGNARRETCLMVAGQLRDRARQLRGAAASPSEETVGLVSSPDGDGA